jgi:hypothetical protein
MTVLLPPAGALVFPSIRECDRSVLAEQATSSLNFPTNAQAHSG